MSTAPFAAVALRAGIAVLALRPDAVLAAFERAPLDAASAALGDVVALSADPVFGNPARCVIGEGARPAVAMAFDLSRPFGLAALSEGQASVARASSAWGVGAGARRFAADAPARYGEREARLVLAIGRGPTSLGVAARGLEVSGDGFAAVRSVAVDAAFLARPVSGLEVGALVESAAGEVPGDPKGARRRAAAGAARDFGRAFRAYLEVQRRGEDAPAGVVGLSWRPVDALALRAGVRGEPVATSCGFSLRLAGSEVNVAVSSADPLGSTVRLGVRLVARP
jgi:hypothetical protein